MTDPITLENDEYWLSVRVVHTTQQQSFGCDAGPANANGNWLFSSLDNSWITFSERNNNDPSASVNWNIRGEIAE